MSIEDFALRFEGMDPVKVKAILDDMVHFLGVLKAEMSRVERFAANLKSQIEAYEAKQRELG